MRISDWSSDVCSSDLQRRGEQPAKQPRPPARGAQRLCHHQHREEYLPAMMVDAQRPELHENIARHDQEQRHDIRSEEHTSELQSLMRISYAVFCLKKNNNNDQHTQ